MNNLFIKSTKTTPEVSFIFESGIMNLSGESYPENSREFYADILSWLREFITFNKSIIFNIKLNYFNTSSSKVLLDIIRLLDNYFKSGGNVELNWYYEEDDEDIYDSGREFTNGLKLTCNFISY